jgi:hypothetical protein
MSSAAFLALFAASGIAGITLGVSHEVPVNWVLENARSGDDESWPDTFGYIERNHEALFPKYWKRFLNSIRINGVRKSILICVKGGKIRVVNGHHRVWGSKTMRRETLPAEFCLEYKVTAKGPVPIRAKVKT